MSVTKVAALLVVLIVSLLSAACAPRLAERVTAAPSNSPTSQRTAEITLIPLDDFGERVKVVGRLNVPLGDVVTVEGVLIEGPFKGSEGGPNLRVQRINGWETQRFLRIPIAPYYGDYYDESDLKPELGKTYEIEGYESGGFVGVPSEAYKAAGVLLQTTGHYFRTELNVFRMKVVEPLRFSPHDFSGRRALFSGVARTENGLSVMEGDGWSVIVDAKAWPAHVEGKAVETRGMYNPTSDRKRFSLVDGDWRLVRLEDQLGRAVALRGMARSLNGVWWFHYRGIDLYVDGMQDMPGWTHDNHYRPMIIRGTLEKANLPRIDQISLKQNRDLAGYFIVRKPSWEPLPELLAPELEPIGSLR